MRWVRIVSWHRIAATYRDGDVGTRCGRMVREVVELTGATEEVIEGHVTADFLPLGEKSCESCLRLMAKDGDV